jgi:hypothetical protein
VRVSKRRSTVKVTLGAEEVAILSVLLDELDDTVDRMDVADPVTDRLFPAGYRDDRDAELEYRELTETSLRDLRRERTGQLRAVLPEGGGTVELDADGSVCWLTVLNDLRLAIGVRLDVTEDPRPPADPDTPDAAAMAIYQWLTVLQDSLVQAVMGT